MFPIQRVCEYVRESSKNSITNMNPYTPTCGINVVDVVGGVPVVALLVETPRDRRN